MRRLLLCCLFLGGLLPAQTPVESDWGPFRARWTDVHGNLRQRTLGPFREHITTPEDWTLSAWRPLWLRWNHDGDEVLRQEFLWPLARSTHRGSERGWRFLLTFGYNQDLTDPESRHRLWVLPFYFHGRDARGNDYRALFPLGGSIHDFLLWEEIDFLLWPLQVSSRTRGIEANTYLWPVYSRTEGPGIERFRIFPFYGYAQREGLGRKTFVLWPFWTTVQYDSPSRSGSGWILFPVAGHLDLEDQQSWWVLPPFFRYHIGEDKNRILGPWPFVQISDGATHKRYLWPLYGTKTIGSTRRQFLLWPFFWHENIDREQGDLTRTWAVPFVQHFHTATPDGDATASRYLKIWPLFSHLNRREGPVRRTVFPDLNPFRAGPLERNYAPFWQLFIREQVGDAVDTEILWGLYRSARRENSRYHSLFPLFQLERTPDSRRFSLLKGLLARNRQGDETSWRVLYLFRFGDKEPSETLP